jgi:hypothetical protein
MASPITVSVTFSGMFAGDIYRPEEWHDFFVMLGGAAAVLTGLVFVALSLNLPARD